MLKAILSRIRRSTPTAPAPTPVAIPVQNMITPVQEHFIPVPSCKIPLPEKRAGGLYILTNADDMAQYEDDDDRLIYKTGFRLILPPGWAAVTAIHRDIHKYFLGYYNSEILTSEDTEELCIRVAPMIGFEDMWRNPPIGAPIMSVWIMPAPTGLNYIQNLEYQATVEAWKSHWEDSIDRVFKPNDF